MGYDKTQNRSKDSVYLARKRTKQKSQIHLINEKSNVNDVELKLLKN